MNKKFYLFAAAAAMLMTACSSDDAVTTDVTPNSQTLTAIGFDTYTAGTTRAGDPEGVMTTDKMKTTGKGFGVFAMFQNNVDYTSSLAPDFMYNEHVSWSGGWTYSPLKYWPNETTQDAQTGPATATQCDKLSFFAYAPYVNLATAGSLTGGVNAYIDNAVGATGIIGISDETVASDPKVEWKYATNLDENIDLLWGVAPAGMAYQSVNPAIYVDKTFGLPLTNMVKPDKDQKIKFLFQHALSRIGLSVVSAIDQIAAGDDGNVFNSAQTRVLIKSVEIYGDFGKQGVLNLNNPSANVANWIGGSITKSAVDGAALYEITPANGNLAADLRYDATQISAVAADANNFAAINPGVLPSEQPLLAQGADPSKVASDLTYAYNKALYKKSGNDYVRATTTATTDADAYTWNETNKCYEQAYTSGSGGVTMNGTTRYFSLSEDNNIVVSGGSGLTNATTYYVKTGSAGSYVYTQYVANGSTDPDGTYYEITPTELTGADYTGTCYTELMPRYFMLIPTGATPIKVKITYAVVTKDEKLTGKVSNVQNEITKETSLTLESGKSYNLKLILGLTSVKLDATVADWQVADELEINLPRNNE